jgi:hypothetical protein
MNALELKKLQAELKRVDAAKEEMEVRVLERQEEIQRLQDNIKLQEARFAELTLKIAEATKI